MKGSGDADVVRRRGALGAVAVLGCIVLIGLALRLESNRRAAPLVSPATRAMWDELLAGQLVLQRATAAQLEALANPLEVRTLFLEAPQLTPDDYAVLARFPHLEHLRVRGARVDDRAAVHLGRLESLRLLNMPQADLTDAGIEALAQLPRLELLRIGSPRVTSQAAKLLAGMPSLRFLHLIGVPIGDEGLAALHGMAQLESLYLDEVAVSDEAIERLLEAQPALHLHLDQQHIAGRH